MILELAVVLMEWQHKAGKLWNMFSGKPYMLRGVLINEDSEGQIGMVTIACDMAVGKRLVDSVAGMQVEPVGVSNEHN